jgi:tRNA(Met) C34 N-acetyltransferase TmcA
MLILQDFEALTPNLLARTIETVEGGGIVVILLRTVNSLKQFYTMTMVSLSFYLFFVFKENFYIFDFSGDAESFKNNQLFANCFFKINAIFFYTKNIFSSL